MIFASSRLVARRFEPRDLADFVSMRSDPEVARFQSWECYSEEDGKRFLADLAHLQPGEPGWFQFALEDRERHLLIGDCGLNIPEHGNGVGEIGYTIARPFWNQGFGTEAVKALVAYAFASFPLHHITAATDPGNLASRRVLEKAGFRQEACIQRSQFLKGEWVDDVIYGMSRTGDQNREA